MKHLALLLFMGIGFSSSSNVSLTATNNNFTGGINATDFRASDSVVTSYVGAVNGGSYVRLTGDPIAVAGFMRYETSGATSSFLDARSGIFDFKKNSGAFTRVRALSLETTVILAGLTDDTPTASEIQTAVGYAASAVSGMQCSIKDSTGSGKLYLVISDGTSWHYLTTTTAL